MCWVGLLSAGVPYPVFWWVAALAMCGAWIRNLRCGTHGTPAARTGNTAAWLVACVVVAVICVVLVPHRPNQADASSAMSLVGKDCFSTFRFRVLSSLAKQN